jgi:hypothetical protein
MNRLRHALFAATASVSLGAAALADTGPVPAGVRHLDHVFLIMMENHGYAEIIGNPYMPFTNHLASHAGLAANYFAVAHPSLTNYLEIVGGSNFGVINDHSPDWSNATCATNLSTGQPSLDESTYPPICPIKGVGTDGATPAIDNSNLEGNQPGPVINVDGKLSYPAAHTTGETIAHQLVWHGDNWKSYQESLPAAGGYGIDTADGLFSSGLATVQNPPSNFGITDGVLGLYAVKHDPFAYFADIQAGTNPSLSFERVAGFDGHNGLLADLESGNVPTFSYIVPNQCNDQHGRSGAGPACDYDPSDLGTVAGLNPALMAQGDATLERLVTAIKGSPVWVEGSNAIVIVWDESDYANAPITNRVTLIVDRNDVTKPKVSRKFYTHFSLLKTLEGGFGLPCLNNACDKNTDVIADLFNGG